jgi:DnaK suppressor protein
MSDLVAIKRKLIARKKDLEIIMAQMYREKVADDQVQDTGDQALTSALEELKISLHNNEQQEYNKIIKALEMIEQGSYGICIECSKPISEKRLALFPNATRCLVCQEALEEGRSVV